MLSQPDINEKMRAILVDWLIETHNKFELMPETLYLTINIIDRFLSVKAVMRRELQLLGVGALFTASKYEEIYAPTVNDCVRIMDGVYSHEQVLQMEKTILGKLEWTLTMCPLTPSLAVYVAWCTLGLIPLWNDMLKLHTGKALLGGGKQQKKNGVAEGENRKALVNISNLAGPGAGKRAEPAAAGVKTAQKIVVKPKVVEDIYCFYKEAEKENLPRDYMSSLLDINEKMRANLVDWLIETHNKFELMRETLYLTINIIDCFLSVKAVMRRELQLLGVGALFTTSKFEEIHAPVVNDCVRITDEVYSHEQVLQMEKTILGKLEWTLTVPTHYVFLIRFIKVSLGD